MILIYSINWVLIGAIVLLTFLGGAYALETTLLLLMGPVKWVSFFIIFVSIIFFASLIIRNKEQTKNLTSKSFAAVFSSISCFAKNSISIVFTLCVMIGFLQNMKHDGIFNVLSAFIIFISDGMVLLIILLISILIDVCMLVFYKKLSPLPVCIIQLAICLIYFCAVQDIIIDYYPSTIELLFAGNTKLIDFILTPLLF